MKKENKNTVSKISERKWGIKKTLTPINPFVFFCCIHLRSIFFCLSFFGVWEQRTPPTPPPKSSLFLSFSYFFQQSIILSVLKFGSSFFYTEIYLLFSFVSYQLFNNSLFSSLLPRCVSFFPFFVLFPWLSWWPDVTMCSAHPSFTGHVMTSKVSCVCIYTRLPIFTFNKK